MAIFWFESNYEKLMPEKIEDASECVELLILQKQLVTFFSILHMRGCIQCEGELLYVIFVMCDCDM